MPHRPGIPLAAPQSVNPIDADRDAAGAATLSTEGCDAMAPIAQATVVLAALAHNST